MFDKKNFAFLLKQAKGDRSINQYALHSGISAAHISRLLRELLDTPPSPETIKLLADKAMNDVTYNDLMKAAGHLINVEDMIENESATIDIGKRIVSLRETKGWTQQELANRVNLDVSVMNRIEINERPVKDNELVMLANILEVSTDYLLGLTDKPFFPSEAQDEADFQAFANSPELQVFYKELPVSNEDAVKRLRDIWEIIKHEKK